MCGYGYGRSIHIGSATMVKNTSPCIRPKPFIPEELRLLIVYSACLRLAYLVPSNH